jgi:hypothetical protein
MKTQTPLKGKTMLKNLIIAILSALTGVIITKHFADKNVIELQREHNRKEHDAFSYAHSAGWDGGYVQGRKSMWMDTMSGNRPDTWA